MLGRQMAADLYIVPAPFARDDLGSLSPVRGLVTHSISGGRREQNSSWSHEA